MDISGTIREVSQNNIALGVLCASVVVTNHHPQLWNVIQTTIKNFLTEPIENIVDLPEIKKLRETYKHLGKSPSRYRGSNEALLMKACSRQRAVPCQYDSRYQ